MKVSTDFTVCTFNGVDILITGAFGCGAFRNPPALVARSWREVLTVYGGKFDSVIFAIYFNENETKNFEAFRDVLR